MTTDVVCLEEHYADETLMRALSQASAGPRTRELLISVEERLDRLDRLGIATQVLALAPPGLQLARLDAPELARAANDRLAHYVSSAPAGRLAAFAALPTCDPERAADELSRCVETLGFVGTMIHGPTDGRFMDDPGFEPILARAAALGVPVYIHPSELLPKVREAYFDPYAATHPMFTRAAWGYTIETGTHAVRMVLSGLFDRLPGLQIILGHLGEAIPFLIDRMDEALGRDTPMKNFREVFRNHFHVTTSGFFSTNALTCCLNELGADRVMFSIDSPYASSQAGIDWLRGLDLEPVSKSKIAAGNARALLGLRK